MIHWAWLFLAFFVGSLFGMLIISFCVAAGREDDYMTLTYDLERQRWVPTSDTPDWQTSNPSTSE